MEFKNKVLILMVLFCPVVFFAMQRDSGGNVTGYVQWQEEVRIGSQDEQILPVEQVLTAKLNNNLQDGQNLNNNIEDANKDNVSDPDGVFFDVKSQEDFSGLIDFIKNCAQDSDELIYSEKSQFNKLILKKYTLFNELIYSSFNYYVKHNKTENAIRKLRIDIKNIVSWCIKNDFDFTLKDGFGYDALEGLELLQKKIADFFYDACKNVEQGEKDIKKFEKKLKNEKLVYEFFCSKNKALLDKKKLKFFEKNCFEIEFRKVYLDLCVQIGKRDRLVRLNSYIDRQIEKISAYIQKKLMQKNMLKENKRKYSDCVINIQN